MIVNRLVLTFAAFATSVWAQLPDGKDIPTAIPISFGQTVEDAASSSLNPNRVYKISLARGQRVSINLKPNNSVCQRIYFLLPTLRVISTNIPSNQIVEEESQCAGTRTLLIEATVVESGTYHLYVQYYNNTQGTFTLRVDAEGTPIAVPNPTRAGCLTGKVDSLTYSLQYIALGIPDEVTIGGTRACGTCQVKAPTYPEMAARLDSAFLAGVNVEACYDSAGSIFQIKTSR